MKRIAWTLLALLLFLVYYLSSIPGLKVLPVLRQINGALQAVGISLTALAGAVAARLPDQFSPLKAAAAHFYRFAQENPEAMEFIVRKAGHLTLYFIITIAFYFLIRQYLQSPWAALVVAALPPAAMAVADEFLQTFVSGRDGSLVDVFIDWCGIGAALFFILCALVITGRYRTTT
jgi:VanZ family protein